MYKKQLFDLVLVYFRDIFDQYGCRSLIRFTISYQLFPSLITGAWCQVFRVPEEEFSLSSRHSKTLTLIHLFCRNVSSTSASQLIYSSSLMKVIKFPTAIVKWMKEYTDISAEVWNHIFRYPWVTDKETKIV